MFRMKVFVLCLTTILFGNVRGERFTMGLSRFASLGCGLNKITDDVYPWLAILEHESPDRQFRSVSKGFLVGPQHVLTSVSSVHNHEDQWKLVSVRLGVSKPTFGPEGLNGTSYAIENIIMHETQDIALLKLSTPVNYTDAVKPICLPDNDKFDLKYLKFKTSTCRRAFVMEHVTTDEPKEETSMDTHPATIVPNDVCSEFYHRAGGSVGNMHICAWDTRGDSCTGDLGGPLMGLQTNKFVAVGIASFVHTKTKLPPNLYPNVYTNIVHNIDWIQTHLEV